jgi:hypothetical protein
LSATLLVLTGKSSLTGSPGQKGMYMSPEDNRKQKSHPQNKTGFKRTLEGVLERLRDGLDELAEGLRPRPQPVPIPVPIDRPRRR